MKDRIQGFDDLLYYYFEEKKTYYGRAIFRKRSPVLVS